MADKSEMRWLLNQLPNWISEGIINAEQAERLREKYSAAGGADKRIDPGMVAIGLVGALLIVGGIISIVAYNWAHLGKAMKLVISFVPVLLGVALYIFTWLKKAEILVWREAGSAVLMLFIGATISLYLQTQEMEVSANHLLLPWMLLSIPLLYGLNASLCAMIYLFGITSWTIEVSRPDSAWYWLLLLGAIPHLVINFRRSDQAIRKQLLSWAFLLSWCFGWLAATPTQLSEFSMLGVACWLSSFSLLSGVLTPMDKNMLRQPFLLIGLAGVFLIVMLGAFDLEVAAFSWNQMWHTSTFPFPLMLLNVGVLLSTGIGLAVLAWLWWKRKAWTLAHAMLLGFPLMTVGYVLLAGGKPESQPAMVLANMYGLALGIAFLRDGVRAQDLRDLNIGMVFILALAIARFFDTDWSLVVKGLAFIVLGVSFLMANVYIAKQKNKKIKISA